MAEIPDVGPVELSLQKYSGLCNVLSYLTADEIQKTEWLSILENIYNHLSLIVCKDTSMKQKILLPKLLVSNFDDEQIWQQIELINSVLSKNILSEIDKKLMGKTPEPEPNSSLEKKSKHTKKEFNKSDDKQKDENIDTESDIEKESESFDDAISNDKPKFDLADMDKFCEEIEKHDESNNSESGEELEDDIFGNDGDDDGEPEEENMVESRLEKELKKINNKIAVNEEQSMEAKSWKMLGESSQRDRETNALLEEHLQFDHGVRAAPEITLETSSKIEKLIIERIKIKLYDDVERKEKPNGKDLMKQKDLPLNQEKSKLSLAEVYEKDYIEALDQASGVEKEEQINEAEESIKIDLDHLFRKLDALSNFSYTPKGVKDEIKIIVNAPTISMEEAMPTAVSDSQVLAPAEIKAKQKEELRTSVEETQTDKKRKRRKIKKSQSIKSNDRDLKKLKLDRQDGKKKVTSKKDTISLVSDEVKQGISLAKKSSEKINSNFFSKLQDSIDQKEPDEKSRSKRSKDKKKQKFNKFG